MKNLLLVTQGFPYGVIEQGFLPTEYEALQRHFSLSVMAFGDVEPASYPLSAKVRHSRYSWPARISPFSLAGQLKYPEVRIDLANAFHAGKRMFLKRGVRIAAYSLRAEQILPMLRLLVQEQRIDIIYTYWCVQATVAALRLKKELPSLEVISRFHGADLYREQREDDWQPLRLFLAQGCDRLVFVSQMGMDYFLDQWGRQWREKALVSYIGCRAFPRCTSERAAGSPLVLISCSSLIPLKRVSLIIEALAQLPPEISVDWHHLGDGELRRSLEHQAEESLANHPHIHYTFHGHVPNVAVAQTYLDINAQLFLTTSKMEGLPVSIMEAYAMGIPVIATAVGGIPEMLTDGQDGFLLSQNPSPAEVAAAIERFVSLTVCDKSELSQNVLARWKIYFNAEANAANLMRIFCRESKGEME